MEALRADYLANSQCDYWIMASVVEKIYSEGIAKMPSFVSSTHYEAKTGSVAYGASTEESDIDIRGFCIPPKEYLFNHDAIIGFDDESKQHFMVYQQHGVYRQDIKYDIEVYSISHFFRLLMDSNPNMVDILCVPDHCILHSSNIGRMVRSERKIFFHKGAYHRFRGYAYSQLSKIRDRNPTGKRKQIIEKFGYDVKYAYHLIRLSLECEMLLNEGDIELNRNGQYLKAVRNGEVPLEDVEKEFYAREKLLQKLYNESDVLPYAPDKSKIKAFLISCIEEYYGNLSLASEGGAEETLRQIATLLRKAGY